MTKAKTKKTDSDTKEVIPTPIDRKPIIARLLKITSFFKEMPKEIQTDAQVSEIERVIRERDFGCKRNYIAELMTAVTGKKIAASDSPTKDDAKNWPKPVVHAVVVATTQVDQHNYGTKPMMITRFDSPDSMYVQCLKETGLTGNSIRRSAMRQATEKEIAEFVLALPESVLPIYFGAFL